MRRVDRELFAARLGMIPPSAGIALARGRVSKALRACLINQDYELGAEMPHLLPGREMKKSEGMSWHWGLAETVKHYKVDLGDRWS